MHVLELFEAEIRQDKERRERYAAEKKRKEEADMAEEGTKGVGENKERKK